MSASLAALLSRPLAGKAAPSARLPLRRAFRLLALEQRFMFDGAAVADAAHVAGDAAILAQIAAVPAAVEVRAANPTLDNGKKEAVLVDTSVVNYKTLEAGITTGMAIIEFDGSKDGLAQIANWAAGQSGYDAIHILSHGMEGTVNLGTLALTNARLSDALIQAELAELGHALKAGGDLLLYGCNIAASSDGERFITDLATASGADVAASVDNTGAAARGGDWALEAATGTIDVTAVTIKDYQGLLLNATFDFETATGTVSGLGTGTVTQVNTTAGETIQLSITSSDGSTLEPGSVLGALNAGSETVLAYNVGTGVDGNISSVTFSLVSGKSFDLSSINLCQYVQLADTITLTSSKGGTATHSFTIGDYYTPYIFNVAADPSATSFQGITSFTLSTADGTMYQGIDDITLTNIQAPGPSTTVTTAALSADTGNSTDFITNTASQTISGALSTNLAAGEKVEVSYNNGTTWSDATTYTTGSNSWSTTTTLAGSNTFQARVTNAVGSSTAFSHSYTLDATSPTVSNVTASTANGSYKAGDTVSVQVTFSEAVNVTGTPQLTLETGTTDRVVNYTSGSGTSTLTFTYTVGASDTSADLDYTTVAALAFNSGTIKDIAGNNAILTLAAPGTAGSLGANKAIVIDTTAPTITFSNLALSADTGSSTTDFITTTANQTISATLSGTLAAGDKVYGSLNGGSSWTDITNKVTGNSLSWVGATLSGVNSIKLKVTDAAGNDGTISSQNYELDTTAPTTIIASAAFSADTGSSSTDFTTKTAAQTISGTLSANLAAGEIVYVSLDNGATWTTASASVGQNTWSLAGQTLTASNMLRIKVTDTAGNDGTVFAQSYVLNTTTPTTSVASAAFSADTGSSSTDFTTKTAAQTISGTLSANLAAGETIYVSLDNGGTWTAASASIGQNTWSLAGQTLTASNTLKIKVTDTAGNDGTVFSQSYVLDTTTPIIPTVSSQSVYSLTPTITGTATLAAGEILTITVGGATYNVTPSSGNWSLDLSSATPASGTLSLNLGTTYSVTATVTDVAGNATSDSTSNELVITNGPVPTTTVATASLSADNGQSSTDFITNTANQTISGTLSANLAAGERVEVSYDNGANWSDATTYTTGSNSWSTTTTLSGSDTFQARVTNAAGSTTAYSHSYVLDTTAPAVTSVSVPANAAYRAGQNLDFTVNFSEAVQVDTTGGTPRIAMVVGSTTVYADYLSGSGTSALMFRYTVSAGMTDTNGITVGALSLNGGTLNDVAGNNASTTLNSVGSTTSVLVDTTSPTNTIATAIFSADTGLNGSDLITQTASQTISGTLASALASGEVVRVSLDGGSNWTVATTTVGQNTWSLAGQTLSGSGTLKVKVSDAAGNDGTVYSHTYTLDGTAPAIASATINGSSVVLTYNETLANGVTPQIGEYVVKVGGNTVTVNAVAYNDAAKTVTLTLATAVAVGDTVSVSYTADGTAAHEVQDVAGNLAANLADRAVTNNTVAAQTQVPPPVVVAEPTPPAPSTPVAPVSQSQTPVVTVTPASFNSAIVLSNSPVGDTSLTGIVNGGTGGDIGKGGSFTASLTSTLTQASNNGFPVAVKSGGFSSDGLQVNRPFADQTLTAGGRTEVTVPADTFSHTSPNAIVTLNAKLANGAPLPAWVSFDAQKGKFVIQPPPGVKGDIAIRLVARDNMGREVVTTFKVHVSAATERNAQLLPGSPGLSEQLQIAAAQGDSLAALRLALRDHAAAVRG